MTRPKVIGLSGFGLYVPDLRVAENFYRTFGLTTDVSGDDNISHDEKTEDQQLLLGSPGRNHHECVLRAGDNKRLHHVSFFIEPQVEEKFAEHLRGLGLEVQEKAPEDWRRDGLWFQDPWGMWVNLSPVRPVARDVAPLGDHNFYRSSARRDDPFWRKLKTNVAPIRLGHMLIFSADWEEAEAFYSNALGLWTSDKAEGKLTFMAASMPAGEEIIDHHCFGIINSTHRGFQHASFEMPSFDHIGLGTNQMREAGYDDLFGPGRHTLGSNLFQYFRDPWGSWIEYYSDMDKISNQWTPGKHNELPYIWGPEWSPEFWAGEMNANLEPKC